MQIVYIEINIIRSPNHYYERVDRPAAAEAGVGNSIDAFCVIPLYIICNRI